MQNKFGLKIYSADHLTVKGGSIRFIFSKEKKDKNLQIIKRNILIEKKLKLGSVKTYKKLKEKNNIIKKKYTQLFFLKRKGHLWDMEHPLEQQLFCMNLN